tara:strand:+ start:6736 stop:7683 length:948 start_codon:yes stop_codon:yes gene_type:complete
MNQIMAKTSIKSSKTYSGLFGILPTEIWSEIWKLKDAIERREDFTAKLKYHRELSLKEPIDWVYVAHYSFEDSFDNYRFEVPPLLSIESLTYRSHGEEHTDYYKEYGFRAYKSATWEVQSEEQFFRQRFRVISNLKYNNIENYGFEAIRKCKNIWIRSAEYEYDEYNTLEEIYHKRDNSEIKNTNCWVMFKNGALMRDELNRMFDISKNDIKSSMKNLSSQIQNENLSEVKFTKRRLKLIPMVMKCILYRNDKIRRGLKKQLKKSGINPKVNISFLDRFKESSYFKEHNHRFYENGIIDYAMPDNIDEEDYSDPE